MEYGVCSMKAGLMVGQMTWILGHLGYFFWVYRESKNIWIRFAIQAKI